MKTTIMTIKTDEVKHKHFQNHRQCLSKYSSSV